MDLRADSRAASTGTKLLLWGLALLGVLFALSILVSLVIAVVTKIVTLVATALVLGGLAYLLASWLLGGDAPADDRSRTRGRADAGYHTGGSARTEPSESSDDGSLLGRVPGLGSDRDDDADEMDRLTERYVNGEIDEAEYERRLERRMDGTNEASLDDLETTSGRSRDGESGRSRTREYER